MPMPMPEPQASTHHGEADSSAAATFSKWREADINDDDYIRDDTDAPAKIDSEGGEDPAAFFRMFGQEDEEDVYEEVYYEYETASTKTTTKATATKTSVVIRHHGEYPNSTGLAVWRGSEILARFLCDQQRLCDDSKNKNENENVANGIVSIRQKNILEVGAGAGLPSIVAHKVLGAKSVLVTDGDYDALTNMKYNVDANQIGNNNNNNTISCQQLIWGRGVGAFLKTHGKQDVVLAADCVYMVPSLRPLWKTIDALLEENGTFVYAQTAASAVPWKDFSEMVEIHGFEVCFQVVGKELDQYNVDNDGDSDDDANNNGREDEEYELGVYVFRRKR